MSNESALVKNCARFERRQKKRCLRDSYESNFVQKLSRFLPLFPQDKLYFWVSFVIERYCVKISCGFIAKGRCFLLFLNNPLLKFVPRRVQHMNSSAGILHSVGEAAIPKRV